MNWDNATHDQLITHLSLHGFDAEAADCFPNALLVMRCKLLDSDMSPRMQHYRFSLEAQKILDTQLRLMNPADGFMSENDEAHARLKTLLADAMGPDDDT